MTDEEMVKIVIDYARERHEEIGDGCARVIASWWYAGQASDGYAFVSTGAISDSTDLWRELFDDYANLSRFDKECADMMGTYLLNAGKRGPQDGWSDRWVEVN